MSPALSWTTSCSPLVAGEIELRQTFLHCGSETGWSFADSGVSRTNGQCVGEMVFCMHEPQYIDEDSSFIYNI